jgi:hypothetical protein
VNGPFWWKTTCPLEGTAVGYEQAAERTRGRAERDEDDNKPRQKERAGAYSRGPCAADDGDVAGEQR